MDFRQNTGTISRNKAWVVKGVIPVQETQKHHIRYTSFIHNLRNRPT